MVLGSLSVFLKIVIMGDKYMSYVNYGDVNRLENM